MKIGVKQVGEQARAYVRAIASPFVPKGARVRAHEFAFNAQGWLLTIGIASMVGFAAFMVLGIGVAWLRRHGTTAVWPRVIQDLIGFGVGLYAFYAIAVRNRRAGEEAEQDEFIEGVRLVSQEKLSELVRASTAGAGPYVFAGVPIPAHRHRLNFLATGSTGSGKTQAVFPLMRQVDDRGIASITYDRKPEFTAMRYRAGKSIILNPMDDRSPAWDLFGEIQTVYHAKLFAESIIAEDKGGNPFFYLAARSCLTDAVDYLWKHGAKDVYDLYQMCCLWSVEELFLALKGYPAANFLDPQKRSAREVHSSMIARLSFLQYFRDAGPKFNIREWMLAGPPKGERVFLTSNPEIHPVVMPVYANRIETAVNAAMSMPDIAGDDEERCWFFLDEFSSMNQLPSAEALLTQARSKGLVTFIGIQDEAQLVERYGPQVAQMIRSGLQTKLILHTADPIAAKVYSDALGMGIWRERNVSIGMRVESGGESASIGKHRGQPRPAVSVTDIMRSRVGQGFLQLTDDYPPAQVTYGKTEVERFVPDFVPRPDLLIGQTGVPRPEHELNPTWRPDPEDVKELLAAMSGRPAPKAPQHALGSGDVQIIQVALRPDQTQQGQARPEADPDQWDGRS